MRAYPQSIDVDIAGTRSGEQLSADIMLQLYAACRWCAWIGAEVWPSALSLASKPPFEAQPPKYSGVVPDS